jgi:hypothetical protein
MYVVADVSFLLCLRSLAWCLIVASFGVAERKRVCACRGDAMQGDTKTPTRRVYLKWVVKDVFGDILLMKVEQTMLHLRHNSILMTAEILMSPKSTDDWVETLQTRSIPLMLSNASRLDINGPCEFCYISMLMKKQRKGRSRHSERPRSKVASDRVTV